MVWMAVVVADDVHVRAVRLALDADVIAWIDLIAVSCALDDDVASSLCLGHKAVATRPDHDPAYLVRVALRAVGADRIHGIALDLHVSSVRKDVLALGRARGLELVDASHH